ncbi:MAG: O-acetylhomoserine aminocarboxypropyltransferase/cysteine synthase family protein [Alphaproteobacteria bacterium]
MPRFETLAIHAGYEPDATGSCQPPVYNSVSFQFRDAQHAANLFTLKELGYVYARLTNPTVQVLQSRLAALEGGVGGVAAASGHAGQLTALFNLMRPGDDMVVSNRLYGGSTSQFKNSFRQFGWNAHFVDIDMHDEVKKAITPKTKGIYCESMANPAGAIADIEALAAIAHENGIPLLVDNTMASPYLMRPIEWGADIVLHSTTKFITGNGSAMGGIFIDSGKFDWGQNDKFPILNGPEPAYDNMNFYETFGKMAFTFRGIAVGLRDLGACQSPMNASLTLNGLETLPLRMQRHCDNSLKVAKFLESHPEVSWVSYAGLEGNPYHALAKKYSPSGFGAVFTFGVKRGYEAAKTMVENLQYVRHVANIGDTRSLIIHPASTTHHQLSPEHQAKVGIKPEGVRVSIGLEHAEDIMADFDQALSAAKAKAL